LDIEAIERIANIGSFIWELSNDYLVCSSNFFRIAESSESDKTLDKDQFFELIDNDSRNFVLDVMHDCIISQNDFEVSFLLKKSGRKIRLFGYPEGEGMTNKIIGIIQDLSGQQEASEAIIKGQDDERKRISLELHDSVGQKLIAAKYQLALIKLEPTEERHVQINDLMDQIVMEVRSITHNLSSQVVFEVGLKNAVGQLLSDTANFLGAKKAYRFELNTKENQPLQLTEEASIMIYRIIQESLTNFVSTARLPL